MTRISTRTATTVYSGISTRISTKISKGSCLILSLLSLSLFSGCNGFSYQEGGRGYWGGWALGGGRDCGAGCAENDRRRSGPGSFSIESIEFGSNAVSHSAYLLSRDYNLKVDSAQKILSVASGRWLSRHQLRQVGLLPEDRKYIRNLQRLPHEVVQRVSAALDEDPAKIRNVVDGFISDMSHQR